MHTADEEEQLFGQRCPTGRHEVGALQHLVDGIGDNGTGWQAHTGGRFVEALAVIGRDADDDDLARERRRADGTVHNVGGGYSDACFRTAEIEFQAAVGARENGEVRAGDSDAVEACDLIKREAVFKLYNVDVIARAVVIEAQRFEDAGGIDLAIEIDDHRKATDRRAGHTVIERRPVAGCCRFDGRKIAAPVFEALRVVARVAARGCDFRFRLRPDGRADRGFAGHERDDRLRCGQKVGEGAIIIRQFGKAELQAVGGRKVIERSPEFQQLGLRGLVDLGNRHVEDNGGRACCFDGGDEIDEVFARPWPCAELFRARSADVDIDRLRSALAGLAGLDALVEIEDLILQRGGQTLIVIDRQRQTQYENNSRKDGCQSAKYGCRIHLLAPKPV